MSRVKWITFCYKIVIPLKGKTERNIIRIYIRYQILDTKALGNFNIKCALNSYPVNRDWVLIMRNVDKLMNK